MLSLHSSYLPLYVGQNTQSLLYITTVVSPGVSSNPNYARPKETLFWCDFDGSTPAVLVLKFPIALPPFSFELNSRLLATASVINNGTASGGTGALDYFSLRKILSAGVAGRGLKEVKMQVLYSGW